MTRERPPPRAGGDSVGARLASLLLLERKLRDAETEAEIGFLLVNDTTILVPYVTAVLFLDGRIAAVTGLPQPVRDAPFTVTVQALCHEVAAGRSAQPTVIDRAMLSAIGAGRWAEFLPAAGLWLPLAGGQAEDGLLLTRVEPWSDPEIRLLGHWSHTAGHALAALRATRPPALRMAATLLRRSRLRWLALVVLVAMFLPVRLSVLAPAEIVAAEPFVVRAPLTGVIEELVVAPNARVRSGDLLLRLNARELEARLQVVRQNLEVSAVEYRLAQQSGIIDQRAQSQVAVLAARIEERRAEVAEVEELLSRVNVVSDRDGIALVPDPTALIGRLVKLGERLMTVADPGKAEIEMWIPVGDAIDLGEGAQVDLFLNVAPENAVAGSLRLVHYQATPSPAGMLGFRAVAALSDTAAPPRVGLRGTAKLYGQSVSLFYYLFRRPLAAFRQMIGV